MKPIKPLLAGLALGALVALSGASAQAASKAHQWEVKIHRTTPDGQTHDATTYVCMGPKQFAKPSKRLTGPRCPNQAFTVTDDAVTWTAACDAAKGQGNWTFSHGGKRFEGQSTIDAPAGRTSVQVEGEVFGTCSL